MITGVGMLVAGRGMRDARACARLSASLLLPLWFLRFCLHSTWLSVECTGVPEKVSWLTPPHWTGSHCSRESVHDIRSHKFSPIVPRLRSSP